MKDGLKYVDVDPPIDINNDGRWAQIERIHEGAEFTCDCRRLPTHKHKSGASINLFFGDELRERVGTFVYITTG